MTFVVPVGPQHPALHEPEHFRVEVRGEEIVDVNIRLGYAHRGIERALQDRSYKHDIYLVERICGICNVTHTTNYCQTVEHLLGIEAPDRARYIRTIVLELERMHSHLLWAGVAANEIGFRTLFMLIWRDRELVLDIREFISGNRITSGTNTIGGVRRDIKPEYVPKILSSLKELEKRTNYYINLCASDRTILARCEGVGVLTKQAAIDLCAAGPTARASGVDADMRRDDPYVAYGEIPFKVVVEREGDVLAKILVRFREVLESIHIIRHALDAMPNGPLRVRAPAQVPVGEAEGRTEAPRGELLYYILSNGTEKPERVRVRTPTYANIPSIKPMFVGSTIAEIPILVISIDPCFACTDRVALVDSHTGKTRVMSFDELRRWRK